MSYLKGRSHEIGCLCCGWIERYLVEMNLLIVLKLSAASFFLTLNFTVFGGCLQWGNPLANVSAVVGNPQANLSQGVRGYWQSSGNYGFWVSIGIANPLTNSSQGIVNCCKQHRFVRGLPIPSDPLLESIEYYSLQSIGWFPESWNTGNQPGQSCGGGATPAKPSPDSLPKKGSSRDPVAMEETCAKSTAYSFET